MLKVTDMPGRAEMCSDFLTRSGWSDASRQPLAGDASTRRYERLCQSDSESAVLMDAGRNGVEDMLRFAALACHLEAIGLSAPIILAADPETGFLLLEDFGDGVFARLIAADPTLEIPLYDAAVDVLAHLRNSPPSPGLVEFPAATLAEFAAIVDDWYGVGTAAADLIAELTRLLNLVEAATPVMALRDYHSENLMWLPDRTGVRKVGLLDFQDAFLCHPAYDLASVLRDARRDIAPELGPRLIRRYALATGDRADDLGLALAVYGAQRNLRILGVFARLCVQDGKSHYVNLIPRVWRHLLGDLQHPELVTLRRIVTKELPEPDVDVLKSLKARCPIIPHR